MSPESPQQPPGHTPEVVAYIGLGSNLGSRHEMFRRALRLIESLPGVTLTTISPLYYTDPVGVAGAEFLNGVAGLRTTLTPPELWQALVNIELDLGRTAKGARQPRTIDLDVLVHGEQVVDSPQLQLPHPRLAERAFVLRPLHDVAAELIIPGLHRTVAQLWEQLPVKEGIRPAPAIPLAECTSTQPIDESHR
jgi:2-amino-4-hydroxy-6-hydroxymethyldihydropteridine diphosphokinase